MYRCNSSLCPSPFLTYSLRRFSLWSMKKDPDLEKALSRNRGWIVNNQIKHILLRFPNQVAPVNYLQKKFKSLDLQGKALNWLKKYPHCFQIYFENNEYYCKLTKQVMDLVDEEEAVKEMQEPVFAERLAKLLMMSVNHRLNVVKLNELKRNFGFPDDYLVRIVSKHPETFRLVNFSGKSSSMEIELLSWNPSLAVSTIEAAALKRGSEPCFSCSLPASWVKIWERFHEFNATPYVSPYLDAKGLVSESKEKEMEMEMEMEKRIVGLVHEILSLTIWKKLSIVKLGHFRREFGLPEKLNVLLIKHPSIFYVSNKYKIYTVLLREGYNGSELVDKDPLVGVKEKFGELMQGGHNKCDRNVLALERSGRNKRVRSERSEQEDKLRGLFDPEERKRFYKILSTGQWPPDVGVESPNWVTISRVI